MTTLIWLLGGVAALMLMRVPVAFSLLIPSLFYIHFADGITLTIVLQRMTSGVDSFPLLAVPMFILMGNLANQAGIADRLFNFALAALGHVRGSLGYVNVASSVVFSWMSGSAMADAASLGKIQVPAMTTRGYDERFSVGLTAAATLIGPIMPPSVTAVVYGVVSGVSIGSLFMAGVVPALLIAAVLSIVVYLHARNKPELRLPKAPRKDLARAAGSASFAILAPVIVLGGILGGVFTPTEAAGAAVFYMIVLGLAYKTLGLRAFKSVFVSTASTTGSIMFIVAAAAVFGWVLGREQVPQMLAAGILDVTQNPLVFLLLLNIFLLLIGMVIEPNSAILILVPVIMPAAAAYGIEPVQLGSIIIFNLMMGLLTPPVGLVLFVLSSVTNIPIGRIARGVVPLLAPLFLVLMIVTYVPSVTLGLPRLLGLL
ncbi:TRAP transporter large permease [Castellaniella sp. S9]|uniref:TRAP transporter large permease n=1 Tax=Castellaniella sp. S9 TaxID=2993652 RepID=UPI0022B2ACC3|nr:TRAP transporter large permease [Castellaniella sp. S9]